MNAIRLHAFGPAETLIEVAGVVDAVGSDVDDAWLGRRVVAHLGQAGKAILTP